jgi:glyoxylate reductase
VSTKIVITGMTSEARDRKYLEELGFEVVYEPEDITEHELAEVLADATGYILGGNEYVSRRILATAKKLKCISFIGVGYESFIDVDAASKLGISITNTPGASANSVAETAIGHMLALNGTFTAQNNARKHGGDYIAPKRRDLQSLCLGIVGLGHIGTAVARKARLGLGMKVVYFNRTRRQELEAELSIAYSPFEQLLSQIDVLMPLIAMTPDTKYKIGEKELKLLNPGAMLVNVARPELVEPNALLDVLTTGHLKSASFDIYYQEPAPKPDEDEFGLLSLPDHRFVLTERSASRSFESRELESKMACEALVNTLSGIVDKNCVNAPSLRLSGA